jgi:hypothetical protein
VPSWWHVLFVRCGLWYRMSHLKQLHEGDVQHSTRKTQNTIRLVKWVRCVMRARAPRSRSPPASPARCPSP